MRRRSSGSGELGRNGGLSRGPAPRCSAAGRTCFTRYSYRRRTTILLTTFSISIGSANSIFQQICSKYIRKQQIRACLAKIYSKLNCNQRSRATDRQSFLFCVNECVKSACVQSSLLRGCGCEGRHFNTLKKYAGLIIPFPDSCFTWHSGQREVKHENVVNKC